MAIEIQAELTCNVWKIQVAAGDSVSEGDQLIILESMKMEIPVESPVSGVISEVCVEEDTAVEEGQILVRIDEN